MILENITAWYWLIYVVVLFTATFTTCKGMNYSFLNSIILANGFSALFVDVVIFLWILPELGVMSPVYPGPSTLVSMTIAICQSTLLRPREAKPIQ